MKIRNFRQTEQGFTLVETIVALVIFLLILVFMMPMFANQRISTLNNEIKMGAVEVSQQIMDNLRQTDIATLPSSGSTTTLPSGQSITSIPAMGKVYSATITYCENAAYCSASTRHIKVKVRHHEQTVYTVETVYSRLQ